MNDLSPAYAIHGFGVALSKELRVALELAMAPSNCSICGHHILDIAAQLRSADAAFQAERPVLFVLWDADHFWIGRSGDNHGCIRCFQLWRMSSWMLALAPSAAETGQLGMPALPAMLATWLVNTVVLMACSPTRPLPYQARMRFASGDLRSVTDHHYIRHPECDRCPRLPDNTPLSAASLLGEIPAKLDGYRVTPLARQAAVVMPQAFDRRCGLVRRISNQSTLRLMPATSASFLPFDNPLLSDHGFGRTGQRDTDAVVAVLEVLERFAGMRPRGQGGGVTGCYAQLAAHAIDPELFILHDREQRDEPDFVLAEYAAETDYEWVWGYSFRRQASVLVPRQIAYYDLGPATRITGQRFVQESSNGCALGGSRLEAVLYGLLEVIERDAFLTSWYAQLPVRRVDISDCEDRWVSAMAARLTAEGLMLEVFAISVGPKAAVLAVRIADPELRFGPAAAFAAGAHLERNRALRSALCEAVSSIQFVPPASRDKLMARGHELLADPSRVRGMSDHTGQCWPLEALTQRHFALAADPPLAWQDIPSLATHPAAIDLSNALDGLVQSSLEFCHDIVVVDQSFEPFAQQGVHCVKVLAPGLLPMTFGHQYRRISKARLQRAPGSRVTGKSPPRQYLPHPFP